MSYRLDLDGVDRLTAAAVGDPGRRIFYLQARKSDVLVSLIVEKEQVAMLATHVDALLERLGGESEEGPDPGSLDLEQPVVPQFRVGQMGLGYDEDRELVVLQCDEMIDEQVEEMPEPDPEAAGRVRLWATPGQMRSLARRGEREVKGGRPVCSMCGGPVEEDGHFCPPSNGHREVKRLQ